MSKIFLTPTDNSDSKLHDLIEKFIRKIQATPPGVCPVSVQLSLLQTARHQSCGKCVPCRDGLPELEKILLKILKGQGDKTTLDSLKALAQVIANTADCAIGYDAASDILKSLDTFSEDYRCHIENGCCLPEIGHKIPCVQLCPAHVNIPGYLALVKHGQNADAINLIRKDNPLPTACAMICEHPCEERCRRTNIDAPLNIRGIKKYAVDQISADKVAVPASCKSTGKKIAVIGGGPAGLTAAYFLSLMGHKAVIFEAHDALGGMLRYGIPNYRFPKENLDEDIRAILSTGNIEVKYNTKIGKDIDIKTINDEYDAMFIAIGAQKGKTLKMDGNDAAGVVSAVDILDEIGHGNIPDYTGKTVVVIGGGNVAMDCARSAVRCGGNVKIVYRRRQEDMTALAAEIEAAIMEGIEILTLQAPKEIIKNTDGKCEALITQPQMISTYKGGRPAPKDAGVDPVRIDCDVVMIAVGQDIESAPFEEFGIPANRGVFAAGLDCSIESIPGVFVGGDCATGPATAIRAIAAGKTAAYNIDDYLGFNHKLTCEASAPLAELNDPTPTGRVNIMERPASERKNDFNHVELKMTYEEAMQETGRCLRCDHFGCGITQCDEDLVYKMEQIPMK
ncbi:MAG: FAD-dependent oxidoreductase [Firmicutes bacterium]|nr:FAD-dependent oxidoreductase [Bacillota bacterium]